MNTCKTCKWWAIMESPIHKSEMNGMGECGNNLMCLAMDELPSQNGLFGHLADPPITGPKFGCVHYRVKE